MGTPQFAVPSLDILVNNGYPVRAVVTAAGKPAGRGLRMREPAVKIAAAEHGIPVLQPGNLKDDEFARRLRDLNAGIFVVVAFRMLPEKIWSIPPMGTINLHASLLPHYRGAAPINHAIINGERVTGVTTFFIDHEIDRGRILMQEKTGIDPCETAGELHDRLMLLGADLLLKTVDAVSHGNINPVRQEALSRPEHLPVAPKISRDDCRINWSYPAYRVFNFVRGLSPFPGAWTVMVAGGRRAGVKILGVEKVDLPHAYTPGKIVESDKDLVIATGDGMIRVLRIQAEGKKAMSGAEFVRGIRPGTESFCE